MDKTFGIITGFLMVGCLPAGRGPATVSPVPPEPAEAIVEETIPEEAPETDPVQRAAPVVLLHVLHEGERTWLVPLACLDEAGSTATGVACAGIIDTTTPAQSPQGISFPLGERGEAVCFDDGGSPGAVAWETTPNLGDGIALWPPAAAAHWQKPSEGAAGAEVRDAVIRQLQGGVLRYPLEPEQIDQLRVTESIRMGSSDQSDAEKVFQAWFPSMDPDKPGNSVLFLGAQEVVPLPTQGLDLNGVINVLGLLEAPGGEFLVLYSSWSGGDGMHVLWTGGDHVVAVGEWVCGS